VVAVVLRPEAGVVTVVDSEVVVEVRTRYGWFFQARD